MSALDRDVLAEKVQAVSRHLARVAQRLPAFGTGPPREMTHLGHSVNCSSQG